MFASKKKKKKKKKKNCRSRGRAQLDGLRDPASRTGGSHKAHRRLQRSFLYDFAAIARGFADLDFDHFHDKLSAKVLHRKRRRSIMFKKHVVLEVARRDFDHFSDKLSANVCIEKEEEEEEELSFSRSRAA